MAPMVTGNRASRTRVSPSGAAQQRLVDDERDGLRAQGQPTFRP